MLRTVTKKKLLMLTHRFPYPADRGDRIRTWNMIKCLSDEFDIYLACLSEEQIRYHDWLEVKAYVKQIAVEKRIGLIQGIARSMYTGKSVTEEAHSSGALRQTLVKWVSQVNFDAGVAFCSSMADYLRDLDVGRKVVDLIDLDSIKWAQYAQDCRGIKQRIYHREAELVRAKEIEIDSWADRVVVISESEADDAVNKLKMTRPIVIPNGVDIPKQRKLKVVGGDRFELVFTGVMNYAPNVEGVKWFVNEVWREIRSNCPEATFSIVGSAPTTEVKALEMVEGVIVTGWVDDVQTYIDAANVVIAPLFTARGLQNKILQAMGAGKVVVASPEAATGLDVVEGRDLMIARNRDAWVKILHELQKNQGKASEIGRAGYAYVLKHHEWGQCVQPLVELLTGENRQAENEIAGHIEPYVQVSQAA